jgi:hypothetical protein
VIDRPYAQLDFSAHLPDRTPSESGDEFSTGDGSDFSTRPHSALGFITQLGKPRRNVF